MKLHKKTSFIRAILCGAVLTGFSIPLSAEIIIGNDLNDANSANSDISALFSANRGTNGGGDQSQQFGDLLDGTPEDDVMIGALGIDVIQGGKGDDILIGGTEDFNPRNRDRAFGDEGNDTFIWAPGDGNDFFDGGSDSDVLIIGLIGENRQAATLTPRVADTNSLAREAITPVFAVSPPGTPGSGDFDGIFLNEYDEPVVDIAGGPGFCEIVEKDTTNQQALTDLNLDHLVRFVLRGPRQNFNETIAAASIDLNTLDDGLRIAVHLKNVEYLACGGETAGTLEVFDLTHIPAKKIDVSELPARAYQLVVGR